SAAFSCVTDSQMRSVFTRPPKISSFSSSDPTVSFLVLTMSSFMALLLALLRGGGLLRDGHLAGLLGLDDRVLLRGNRLPHDQVGAGGARHGAADDQHVVLAVDRDDLQVARRHLVAAHPSGRAHALDDARGERRGADRAGRAVEHRAVGRRAAGEVVALHDALEPLAAADADDVDAIAVLEHAGDQDLVAGLERRVVAGALGELDFAADAGRRHVAGLLVVAAERLVDLGGLLFDEAELHGLVAVGLRGLGLQHDARAGLDEGRRRDGAVRREHLRHAELPGDDSSDHGYLCSLPNALISTSTPAGRSSFISASTVCGVGSKMSISRLCVRSSNCSRDFLSTCGERSTVHLFFSVGKGIGPASRAPVRRAVSTISVVDWSSTRLSYAFRRMRILSLNGEAIY